MREPRLRSSPSFFHPSATAGTCGPGLLSRLCRGGGSIGGHAFLRSVHTPWQPDRKGRSATNLALDRDIASHHLTEASAYGEAEAGAAIFARRGGIGLGKILEQLTHLFRRHADASILYRERNPIAAVLLSMMS